MNFEEKIDVHFTEEEIKEALLSEQDGDAKLYTRLYRNRLCFDHSANKWFKWEGNYWKEDDLDEQIAAVKMVVEIYEKKLSELNMRLTAIAKRGELPRELEYERKQYLKKISKLQKLAWKKSVLKLATAGKNTLGITGKEWDKNPWLLGCSDGVIDLKSGKLCNGHPEEYIKTVCPTKWKGINHPATTWEKFLEGIFDGNQDTVSFLNRLLGYAITGLTTEHIFCIFWGKEGRNGKSTLLEILFYVLGPLAGPVQAEMLLEQGRSRSSAAPSPDIMNLRGKRLVWASETDEGRKLNMGKIKMYSGGDTLCGRPPFGKRDIYFQPSHKLFLLTNHIPKADPYDKALWKRILLIPFCLSFVSDPQKENERQRDPNLIEKLKAEAPGILAWLVRGCLEWQLRGLNSPKIMQAATEEYRKSEDSLGQFIEDRCLIVPGFVLKAGIFYEEYKQWCIKTGMESMSIKRFGEIMKDRFEWKRTNSGIIYRGIVITYGVVSLDPMDFIGIESEGCVGCCN